MLALYTTFLTDTGPIQQHARDVKAELGQLEAWRIRYFGEGLLADLWQTWSGFCREVVMKSCQGCITRPGRVIPARTVDNHERRIGYEAAQAARGRPIAVGSRISSLRHEPTWGDTQKLVPMLPILNPVNLNQLIGAFGGPSQGPKHLQIIRNACFHNHVENLSDARAIGLIYGAGGIATPSELVWHLNARTGQYVFHEWIAELENIAAIATQ